MQIKATVTSLPLLAVGILLFSGAANAAIVQNPNQSISDRIELAHATLWDKFIDKHGVIHDYIGELPTPEDCTLGRPNAIGWWSQAGIALNATNALAAVEAYRGFNNNDTKVFGNANWRAVYTTWRPQPTQADAEKLSSTADVIRQGERKRYEARLTRNPLAAAAIVALAGDGTGDEAVERVICHYDYSKLHMAEFFFAECAFYALPQR